MSANTCSHCGRAADAPVKPEGGCQVTYGAWLAINLEKLPETFAVWWDVLPHLPD